MEPKANLNKDEMVNMIRHGASYVFSTKDGDITDIDTEVCPKIFLTNHMSHLK